MAAKREKGFTLLEALLVIAIIVILVTIVIIAIGPGEQSTESRNAQRQTDINTISNIVYQYTIENNGEIPGAITNIDTEICSTTGTIACAGLVDLSRVLANGKYATELPLDPDVKARTSNGTGYKISTNGNRITVSAPATELSKTISVVR